MKYSSAAAATEKKTITTTTTIDHEAHFFRCLGTYYNNEEKKPIDCHFKTIAYKYGDILNIQP